MSLATGLLVVIWCSATAYTLLAGADFGAGIWDLLAGAGPDGRRRRVLMEHVIGPVWEANHVWLIFVLVLLWTCFPPVFSAVASTLWLPLMLVALGVIGRGAAFAFRKAVATPRQRRAFGVTFAVSSLMTPFFLGAMAGAIASDRVPPGIAAGAVVGSWLNPSSLLTGALAASACAFLAAVYLTGDARRAQVMRIGKQSKGREQAHPDPAEWFRRRALASGAITGALSLAGVLVARADAPSLYHGLTHRAAPLVVTSAAAGCAALGLVAVRRYLVARAAAGLAVAAIVWGWGIARYPQLLPGLPVSQAQALPATLHATALAVAVGLALLVPSLLLLLTLFQREQR
ncbi:MAG TPA: cytochrome d ubiquinol oxidase subunit II [Jatrophihabitantaceae bacterium]|jgi:cytochrome d ubiquinol oxidase subunit II